MFPNFYLTSLEDALMSLESLNRLGWWHQGWLPIFHDGSGDFMIVDLSPAGSGQVLHYRNEFDTIPLEYESLSAMMATIAAAFDRGIFYVSATEPAILEDWPSFCDLAASMNPTIQWWNDPDLA
jgi:cell wall assembly regulator SMI1